jgi:hypothetical protein
MQNASKVSIASLFRVKNKQSKKSANAGRNLNTCFLLVSCFAYTSNLMMMAVCASKTLGFYRTTW